MRDVDRWCILHWKGAADHLDRWRQSGARPLRFEAQPGSPSESARAPAGEEQLSLATAMQLAGYTHAIGSLQPVFDEPAAEFMIQLHTRLARGTPPAVALHHTRDWARSHWPDQPHHWAVWTHIGP